MSTWFEECNKFNNYRKRIIRQIIEKTARVKWYFWLIDFKENLVKF